MRLARIAQQTQKESKRVQVLSIIAIMYLPASLIAVRRIFSFRIAISSFSSDYFQLQSFAIAGKRRQRPRQRVTHCNLISILDLRGDLYLLSSRNSCISVILGQKSLQSLTVTTAYVILIRVALEFQA